MDLNTPSDIDIETNRANIAYARSTKLIKSWLPPPSAEELNAEHHDGESQDENDSDFKSMPERSGLGSKMTFDEESGTGLVPLRRRGKANDKLLEQLFGRRAPEVEKKLPDSKDTLKKKHAGSQALTSRPKHKRDVESDEEDEGGRSAAFKSRKPDRVRMPDSSKPKDATMDVYQDGEETTAMSYPHKHKNDSRDTDSDDEEKPAKRRKNTYLDELLTNRAKKGKKKKK